MANIERLRQVLNLIKENPKHWDQGKWHCGTSHCFAGFADCLANNVDFRESTISVIERDETRLSFGGNGNVANVARKWLGLSEEQAISLFRGSNSLEDLEHIINEIELGSL